MPKQQSPKERLDFPGKPFPHSSGKLTRRPLRIEDKPIEEDGEEESDSNVSYSCSDRCVTDSEELHSSELDAESGRKKSNTSREKFIGERNDPKRNVVFKPSDDRLSVVKHFFNPIYILIAVFSVVCVVYILFYSVKKSEPKVSLSQIIKDMENNFDQSDLMYRNLRVQLKKIFNVTHEPSAPAIITAIANKGAESSASNIALYLGNALAPGRYILINGSGCCDGNPDDIKFKIDEDVKSRYQLGQLNVIIIDKLQKIPFEAAMIFHSYCDHENSPFKRALFMFILPLDKILSESADTKEIDSVAMKSLRNVWPRVTDDKVDSLITRIAGAVINIK